MFWLVKSNLLLPVFIHFQEFCKVSQWECSWCDIDRGVTRFQNTHFRLSVASGIPSSTISSRWGFFSSWDCGFFWGFLWRFFLEGQKWRESLFLRNNPSLTSEAEKREGEGQRRQRMRRILSETLIPLTPPPPHVSYVNSNSCLFCSKFPIASRATVVLNSSHSVKGYSCLIKWKQGQDWVGFTDLALACEYFDCNSEPVSCKTHNLRFFKPLLFVSFQQNSFPGSHPNPKELADICLKTTFWGMYHLKLFFTACLGLTISVPFLNFSHLHLALPRLHQQRNRWTVTQALTGQSKHLHSDEVPFRRSVLYRFVYCFIWVFDLFVIPLHNFYTVQLLILKNTFTLSISLVLLLSCRHLADI